MRDRKDVQSPWLRGPEAAAYLGVSKSQFYRWLADEGLPSHKIGGTTLFRRDELDKFVMERSRKEARK